VKHRYPIPFFDDADLTETVNWWAHRHGWHVIRQELRGTGIRRRDTGELRCICVTLAPWDAHAAVGITAHSGVTLVYDDVEQTMGVTLLPEPRDAVPPQPEDVRPR
jgi:hypothetical protein